MTQRIVEERSSELCTGLGGPFGQIVRAWAQARTIVVSAANAWVSRSSVMTIALSQLVTHGVAEADTGST
jgi:hypothetical protein